MLDFEDFNTFETKKEKLLVYIQMKDYESAFTFSSTILSEYYKTYELKSSIKKIADINQKSLEKMLKGVI